EILRVFERKIKKHASDRVQDPIVTGFARVMRELERVCIEAERVGLSAKNVARKLIGEKDERQAAVRILAPRVQSPGLGVQHERQKALAHERIGGGGGTEPQRAIAERVRRDVAEPELQYFFPVSRRHGLRIW